MRQPFDVCIATFWRDGRSTRLRAVCLRCMRLSLTCMVYARNLKLVPRILHCKLRLHDHIKRMWKQCSGAHIQCLSLLWFDVVVDCMHDVFQVNCSHGMWSMCSITMLDRLYYYRNSSLSCRELSCSSCTIGQTCSRRDRKDVQRLADRDANAPN